MKLLPQSPQYSDVSVFRLLIGASSASVAALLYSGGSVPARIGIAIAAAWVVGVLFRLVDLGRQGFETDGALFMNSRTWVFDVSLRGYFRGQSKEPGL